jgi:hypothetical protein
VIRPPAPGAVASRRSRPRAGGRADPEAPFVIEHREALIYMLCQAAEVKHAIMCQYLFAAFSLKQRADEGLTPEELDAVTRRRRTIAHVATEEMLHLVLGMFGLGWRRGAHATGAQRARGGSGPRVTTYGRAGRDDLENRHTGHRCGGVGESAREAKGPAAAGPLAECRRRDSNPDTRIMIPAGFGLVIENLGPIGHAVGHNRSFGRTPFRVSPGVASKVRAIP